MRALFLIVLIFTAHISFAQTRDSAQVFRCFAGEEMPEFPGGQDKLPSYFSENLRYPDIADSDNTEGRCVLRFVVNEDGSISDLKVIKSLGSTADEEVIKLVSRMPCWKPGKLNGVPAKITFFLPVTIHLE